MKVVFLSESSVHWKNSAAQVHRLKKLEQGLNSRGIETDFIALPDLGFAGYPILFPLNYRSVRKRLQDCDFIHAVGDTAFTAMVWKIFCGATVIHDVDADTLAEAHMYWRQWRDWDNALLLLQTHIMNWVEYRSRDYFTTVSRPLQQRLINDKGVPEKRLVLVRNGVDTGLFKPRPRTPSKEFTVCYAGGFHVWQGIENLINTAKLLEGESIRFQIVGFQDQNAEIKQRIRTTLSDKVELIDRIPQEELIERLSQADLLLIPRTPDPAVEIAFPTKFAEYLSMARPVLVTDVDETATLVREYKCGLVVEPEPAAIAAGIKKAAALDVQTLSEMGANGRRLAESAFSWPVICQDYAAQLIQWKGTP
ncbi:MAG: glycosyltransferase family 4 protein [Gammaproteobacteria bacterium]